MQPEAGGGEEHHDDEERGGEMRAEGATKYRAIVACCNLLGSDRPDLLFAGKEASRWMAKPCYNKMEKAGRIAKCPNGDHHRLLQLFPPRPDHGIIHVFSDCAWAGCLRTLSIIGGVLCEESCAINNSDRPRALIRRGCALRGRTRFQRGGGPEHVRVRPRPASSDTCVSRRSNHDRR